MQRQKPSIILMTRAPFLSSIISPIVFGSLLAVYLTGKLELINFIIVFFLGVCLHVATNVYNDIYDTLQGTDKINVHRNEFSGGSGVLVDSPELMPAMYRIARLALAGALLSSALLFFRIDAQLRLYLVILFFLSAFFSKFYTAAPLKLAYRGLGEVSVWFAFGPMAILVAAVSQNVGLHPVILAAMPLTGISTLSILLIGQVIDLEADRAAGKWGVAVRLGLGATSALYLFVQLFLCVNLIILSLVVMHDGWPLLFALVPYAILLPKIFVLLRQREHYPEPHKKAAGLNVTLHLLFALLSIAGMIVTLLLK